MGYSPWGLKELDITERLSLPHSGLLWARNSARLKDSGYKDLLKELELM